MVYQIIKLKNAFYISVFVYIRVRPIKITITPRTPSTYFIMRVYMIIYLKLFYTISFVNKMYILEEYIAILLNSILVTVLH